MRSRKTMDLTTGPIMGKMMIFVMPILFSNLVQHLYNAADKAVVGHFVGSGALAAVGASSPAITLIVSLFTGLSIASNIICSNYRGAKDEESLRRFMHSAISTACMMGLVLFTMGQIAARPILTLMDTPESVMDKGVLYMRIYFAGVPASLVYNFGSGILRAHGDSSRPMKILSISGLANVLLNLFFVLVCKMDVDGVALATAAAHYISAGWVLWLLFAPKGEYRLQLKKLGIRLADFCQIIRVGVPCSINSIMFSLSNAIMQPFVNVLGETVLAGNTAANGVVNLVHQIMAAFYAGCISIAGQCYGAKKYSRVDKVLKCSLLASVGSLTVVAIVVTLIPRALISIFNSDPAVVEAGMPRLLICTWGYILYAVADMFLGCLRGMKRTTVPALMNVFTICAPRILWVYLVYPLLPQGTASIFLCYPVSYVISIVAFAIYYFRWRKVLSQRGDEVFDPVTA